MHEMSPLLCNHREVSLNSSECFPASMRKMLYPSVSIAASFLHDYEAGRPPTFLAADAIADHQLLCVSANTAGGPRRSVG